MYGTSVVSQQGVTLNGVNRGHPERPHGSSCNGNSTRNSSQIDRREVRIVVPVVWLRFVSASEQGRNHPCPQRVSCRIASPWLPAAPGESAGASRSPWPPPAPRLP